MPFSDFIQATRRNSGETAKTYGNEIGQVAKHLGKDPDRIAVDIKTGALDLIDFFRKLNAWSGEKKHKATTTAIYFASWKAFLRYEGVKIDDDEVRSKVRPPRKRKSFGGRPFKREELTHILDIVNLKYRAVILLGATSGMRAGEINALRIGDIDLSKSPAEIVVRGETSKSGRDRITFCSDEAVTHLKAFLGERTDKTDFVFRREQSKEGLSNRFSVAMSRILERAGIHEKNGADSRYSLSFHSLRKYFTTQMVEAGVPLPIVELLCGREIGTTQSYLMPSPDKMRKYYADTMRKVILTQAPMQADLEKIDERIKERDTKIAELEQRLAKAEKEKPDLDKYFEENIEEIIKKFNKYGVDMKIRDKKRR